MPEVIAAQQAANAQQIQDQLPVYTIYRDTPGSPNLAGPRSPGTFLWSGRYYNSYGIANGSAQDPAVGPLQTGAEATFPAGMVTHVFRPPAIKVLLEPKQYVPGTGWVGIADVVS